MKIYQFYFGSPSSLCQDNPFSVILWLFFTFLLIQFFRFSHLTNYICCKLNPTFFNLEQDVYLCALNIPPHGSPYFESELFANIETDIALFHRKGAHKCVASKFRVRNHKLKIETGRFTIPKTPEDLRICDHCSLNSVENEMHVLFHCDLYDGWFEKDCLY